MRFQETRLAGALIIDLEPRADGRGFFARTFCRNELEAHGLEPGVAQCNMQMSLARGTWRGLHFQAPPAVESKLVRCTRGAILDVIVDLRPESATYLQHISVELTAASYRGLFVPGRFAHGYVTLANDTEVTYMASAFYAPQAEGGLHYDDPALGIELPLAVEVISDKDSSFALLDKDALATRMRV